MNLSYKSPNVQVNLITHVRPCIKEYFNPSKENTEYNFWLLSHIYDDTAVIALKLSLCHLFRMAFCW